MGARKNKSSNSSRFALRADSGLYMGNVFPLISGRTVIGRSVEVEVPVDDTKVSRAHAALDFQAGHPVVVDLGSTNGTFVNGLKVEHVKRVVPGDKIRVGSSTFVLELFDEAKQRLKKTWKAPTQAIMRSSINKVSAALDGATQVAKAPLRMSADSTGIRWQWLLDTKVWQKNKKSLEPWILAFLCGALLVVALWL